MIHIIKFQNNIKWLQHKINSRRLYQIHILIIVHKEMKYLSEENLNNRAIKNNWLLTQHKMVQNPVVNGFFQDHLYNLPVMKQIRITLRKWNLFPLKKTLTHLTQKIRKQYNNLINKHLIQLTLKQYNNFKSTISINK